MLSAALAECQRQLDSLPGDEQRALRAIRIGAAPAAGGGDGT